MFTRRKFLTVLGTATIWGAQRENSIAQSLANNNYPIQEAEVEVLWKSPDGHPNALEATEKGLWVGEQVTDVAYLLDWKTGGVLKKIPTESSNTSGMAYGGGFLWMAANGPCRWPPGNKLISEWRELRPTDAKTGVGEVVKIDPITGATVSRHLIPGGGGVHGLTWDRDGIWITTFQLPKNETGGGLTKVDLNFKVLHTIPVTLKRSHGLATDQDTIWCMFSNDFRILRMDKKDGRILKAIQLSKSSHPDPHGMTRHNGKLYYCDAGIGTDRQGRGVGAGSNKSPYAGSICRIHLP